jgi:hypothetical protein
MAKTSNAWSTAPLRIDSPRRDRGTSAIAACGRGSSTARGVKNDDGGTCDRSQTLFSPVERQGPRLGVVAVLPMAVLPRYTPIDRAPAAGGVRTGWRGRRADEALVKT